MKIVDIWYSLVPVLVAFNFFEQDLTGLVENLQQYNTYLLIAYCFIALLEGTPLLHGRREEVTGNNQKEEQVEFTLFTLHAYLQ